ncbi:MAG: GDSL-type esterase/lipase family protein [Pseudomonadota bacterium]
MSRRPGPRAAAATRHRREHLGALGLGLLVFLALLEVGLRLAGAHVYPRPHPTREGAGFVILCVGDSFTAGTVAGDYPRYLGEILTQRGHPVRVEKAGLGGANSTMVREALPGFLDSSRPDLVVLLAGGSNQTSYYGYSRFMEPTWRARADDLLFSIRVWRLGRYAWTALRGREASPTPSPDDPEVVEQSAPPFKGDFDRRLAGCLQRDVRSRARGATFEVQYRCVEAYLQDNPEDSLGYWALGQLAEQGRSWEEAESAYRTCLARDPEQPACLLQLGLVLDRRDETRAEALELLQASARLRPHSALVHLALGICYVHARRFDKGVAELMACIEDDPSSKACFDNLGSIAQTEDQRRAVMARLAGMAPESGLARDYLQAFEAMVSADLDPMADLAAWAHADLTQMVAACRAHGAPVVLQDYPNDNRMNAVLREVAMEHDLPFVHQHEAFEALLQAGTLRGDLFEPDGHPNPTGYRRMAEVLADALEQGGVLP